MTDQRSDALVGQVAVVTGAGQGIGLEICRVLAMRGARVLLNDVDRDLAESAAESLSREGAQGPHGSAVRAIPGDAGDLAFLGELTQRAVAEWGRLDLVVANAGVTVFGDFLHYQPAQLESVIRLNLLGSFFLAQHAARQMIRQGNGGRIVFMSSVTGHQAHEGLVAYGMTKAALEMLAKGLVVELSPFRITVNTVAPGATLTERTLGDPSYASTWARITPTGRAALPRDIAHAVAFLVSPEAEHITGQTLVIDGGWTSVSPAP